jgi:hypothetical protein
MRSDIECNRVIAAPEKDQVASFAKAITRDEFGRFYWDERREVRRSLASAMARVKEERRARAKLIAKAKK